MEKHQTLLAKYQALVSEWNTIFLASAVLFASTVIGLIVSMVFYNWQAVIISLVLMFIFATFEHRSRKIYFRTRMELEEQIFKLSGMRKPEIKEIVNEGLIW